MSTTFVTGELLPATAITTSGSGSGVDLKRCRRAIAVLRINTVSGTSPSLTVSLQTSPDNATWTTQASFAAVTAAGRQVIAIPVSAGTIRYVRATWTVSGTSPSFTGSCCVVGVIPVDSTLAEI